MSSFSPRPFVYRKNFWISPAGFTLIELMIVITILAAIVIIVLPSFIGQSDKAHDAAAKSDLVNVYREAAPLWAERDQIPANIVSQISGNAIPVEQGSHWSKEAVSVNRIQPDWITFRREAENGDRFMIVAPLKGKPERYSLKADSIGETRTNDIPTPFPDSSVGEWVNFGCNTMQVVPLASQGIAPIAGITKGIRCVSQTDGGARGVRVPIHLSAGDRRRLSAYVYINSATPNTSLLLYLRKPSSSWTATASISEIGKMKRIDISQITDETGLHWIELRRSGSASGTQIDFTFTAVMAEDAPSLGSVFPTPGQLASGEVGWTGEPFQSASTISAWQSW